DRLNAFLRAFSQRFYSSQDREHNVGNVVQRTLDRISETPNNSKAIADAIEDLRRSFGERIWTALIVPSGDDPDVDRYLCSDDFLRRLLGPPMFPGLILQLVDPPSRKLVLNHIFPAFQIALMDSSTWPGILVWTRRGQGTFFPFGSTVLESIDEKAGWIVN